MLPSSVVHTGVKSLGCENSTVQESPIQSWKRMRPSVVSASKSGATSLICSDMSCSFLGWSSGLPSAELLSCRPGMWDLLPARSWCLPFPASLFFVLVAKWRTWFNVRHGKRPRTILPDCESVGSLRDALDSAHLARVDD